MNPGNLLFLPGDNPFSKDFRERLNSVAEAAFTPTTVSYPLMVDESIGERTIRIISELPGGKDADTVPVALRYWKITSSNSTGVEDSNSNPVQWTYAVTEVRKLTVGYGGWSVKDEDVSYTGYNFLEDANTGVGRQQNGINHDGDYPPNYQMYPLQDDSIHPGVFLVEQSNGDIEVWLMPYSAEDGTCT
jgi:hypothetical protein